MTTRARSRHRASVRPNTPLSSLTTAVTGQMNALGRGGVVIAMSSGLVATMGLPAQAASNAAGPETAAAPAAAPAAGAPAGAAFYERLAHRSSVLPDRRAAHGARCGDGELRDRQRSPRSPSPSPHRRGWPTTTARRARRPRVRRPSSYGSGGFASAKGSSVLSVAARYVGVPYRLRRHDARWRLRLLRGRPLHLPAARRRAAAHGEPADAGHRPACRARTPRPATSCSSCPAAAPTTWASTRATT